MSVNNVYGSGRLILLVEDDPILRLDTSNYLEECGYCCHVCKNGSEAIAFTMGDAQTDFILMDIGLGSEPDGIETAQVILAEKDLPVVFLTGHTEDEILEQIRAVTRYGFVLKGSGQLVLLSAVEMALELWDARQQQEKRLIELHKSRERFRLIFESAPIGIIDFDDSGVIQQCNDAFIRIIGSSREKLIGLNMLQLPDKKMVKALSEALGGREGDYEGVYHSVTADKQTPVRGQFVPLFSENKTVSGGLGMIQDISREQQALERHRSNADRLDRINRCLLSLTDNYHENINQITALGGELFGGICALYNRLDSGLLCSLGQWQTPPGYNPIDQPEGHLCFDVINLAHGDFLYKSDLQNSPYVDSDPNVRPYKLKTYVGHAVRSHGKPVGSLCVVFQDHVEFTDDDRQLFGILALALGNEEERHSSQRALTESERRFGTLMQNINGMTYRSRLDQHGTMVFVSAGCYELTGWTVEEMLGYNSVTFTKLIHPDDDERVFTQIKDAVAADVPYVVEYRIVDRQGRVKRVWEKGRAVDTDSDGAVYLEGLITENTEYEARRESEARLAEQSARLNALIKTIPDLLFVMDPQGTFVEYYASDQDVLAMSPDRVIGSNLIDLFGEEEANRHLAVYKKCLESGELQTIEYTIDFPDHRGYYEARITPINKGLVLSIVRDISSTKKSEAERTRLERQLQQTQRMDTIGTLAGGIAHDFNNILTPILGFSELILQSMAKEDTNYELVERIREGAQQARNLIRQILMFNRAVEHNEQELDLARLVEDTVGFLRPTIPATVDIRTVYRTEVSPVTGDLTQLQQVLVNLCTNAYQALDYSGTSGGRISVELSRQVSRSRGGKPIEFAQLDISDNGPGIAPDIIDRIFEPFFTTKEVDKGTGLGLSVVHGIIQSHGGQISVQSEPGKGTCFTILLPVAGKQNLTVQQTKQKQQSLQGEGVIWVMDDDRKVAEVIAGMVSHAGYSPVIFTSTAELLRAADDLTNRIDLLLTDLTMPGMTGVQLAEAVARNRPELPVVLMTGYGRPHEGEIRASRNIRTVLGKPLEITDLLESIKQVLEETN